jgi:fluoride ion exporter CrcB/FEX
MFKNIWIRLGGCVVGALAAWLLIKFMNVQDNVVTAHTLIIVLTGSFIAYALVHPILEGYVISKKDVLPPKV